MPSAWVWSETLLANTYRSEGPDAQCFHGDKITASADSPHLSKEEVRIAMRTALIEQTALQEGLGRRRGGEGRGGEG